MFRLGEVYLNFAEAKAELGTLTQSDLDKSVNLLRDRVGMPHLTMGVTADPYLSDRSLLSQCYRKPKSAHPEIRRERAIELAQEGFKLDDVFRWKCGRCSTTLLHTTECMFQVLENTILTVTESPRYAIIEEAQKSKATTTCESV